MVVPKKPDRGKTRQSATKSAGDGNSAGGARAKPPRTSRASTKRVQPQSAQQSEQRFVHPLRELLMVRLSRIINERGWTQAEAAKFLGVTQPRISDLKRIRKDKFTIDMLIQWLGMLGEQIKIDVQGPEGVSSPVYPPIAASEDAIPYYTQVIAADPMNAENYIQRGQAYHNRQQYELAIGDYTRALELCPDLQLVRIYRAQSYTASGQHRAAIHDCDQLIEQQQEKSTLVWAYMARASARHCLMQDEAAIEDYDRAAELAPELVIVHWSRAMLHESLSRFQEAFDDYSTALKLEPTHVPSQRRRLTMAQRLSEIKAQETNALTAPPGPAGAASQDPVVVKRWFQRMQSSIANVAKHIMSNEPGAGGPDS